MSATWFMPVHLVLTDRGSTTSPLGPEVLVLAIGGGLAVVMLALLVMVWVTGRGAELRGALQRLISAAVSGLRERGVPDAERRLPAAERHRRLVDAWQDLNAAFGSTPTSLAAAETMAYEERTARDADTERAAAAQARAQSRARAQQRREHAVNRAREIMAIQRARDERIRLAQTSGDVADLPDALTGMVGPLWPEHAEPPSQLISVEKIMLAAATEQRAVAERAAAEALAVATEEEAAAARAKAAAEAATRRVAEATQTARKQLAAAAEAQRRRQSAESSTASVEQRAVLAQRQMEAAQRRVAEVRREMVIAERKAEEANRKAQEAEQRAQAAERKAQEAELKAVEAEQQALEAGRRAEEAEPPTEQAASRADVMVHLAGEGQGQPAVDSERAARAPSEAAAARSASTPVPITSGRTIDLRRVQPGRVSGRIPPGARPSRSVGGHEDGRPIAESGHAALAVVEDPGPSPVPGLRLPVSATVARGSAVVRVTEASYRMAVQVDAVRARLVEWRAVDERAMVRAGAGARAARVCLLSLVPLILVVRASLDVSTLSRTLSQPVALVAIATLTLVGSAWAWRVTTPPFALIRRPSAHSRGEPIRGRLASELLAVLLSLDVPASQAQRRVRTVPPAVGRASRDRC